LGEVKRGGPDENFSSRIKEIEMKFKGTAPVEKKPRDLHRAIGKSFILNLHDISIKKLKNSILDFMLHTLVAI
jgi:hypothetical protein